MDNVPTGASSSKGSEPPVPPLNPAHPTVLDQFKQFLGEEYDTVFYKQVEEKDLSTFLQDSHFTPRDLPNSIRLAHSLRAEGWFKALYIFLFVVPPPPPLAIAADPNTSAITILQAQIVSLQAEVSSLKRPRSAGGESSSGRVSLEKRLCALRLI
eukprot:TRINITY_DN14081_c0_g1_i1.p1 TRINITY_DN14081_c0_g1~~TRINITY_DN14081_c0_g1_i1.p1  ORF type:complete len:155 (+),score=8.15 TRINITY_DN14081_c0_g1_i1:2-466(+)